MTRLLITADLHYNHARSRPLAEALIDQMNAAGGDMVLLVGDAASGDGDALERCLARFRCTGPKLFVAGNHELWTRRSDSAALFRTELPRRVREAGWHWLETDPFIAPGGGFAIVGSVGWYDYAFAVPELGIPKRFYARKVSPGAAARLSEFAGLLDDRSDVTDSALDVVARWNDGKFVKLYQSDEAFLDDRLVGLEASLRSVEHLPRVIAAVHHVPFEGLLPPRHGAQWDFARAYLGSPRIGELLARFENVRNVFCGHSHFAVEAQLGRIHAVNIGSGYRAKTFRTLELPDGASRGRGAAHPVESDAHDRRSPRTDQQDVRPHGGAGQGGSANCSG